MTTRFTQAAVAALLVLAVTPARASDIGLTVRDVGGVLSETGACDEWKPHAFYQNAIQCETELLLFEIRYRKSDSMAEQVSLVSLYPKSEAQRAELSMAIVLLVRKLMPDLDEGWVAGNMAYRHKGKVSQVRDGLKGTVNRMPSMGTAVFTIEPASTAEVAAARPAHSP
ncbi:MAG: hypothetical protein OXP09_21535 [Gammaproteobacteria bacterium]|nr:hypothetical protein [Rhodospirillaceae bacterium]MDE0368139.1 hypothetical protein [Gammaproteobacteria bacterium]